MSKSMNKTPGQNTTEKTFRANFIEEVPLKNIYQIKWNYLQISLGLTQSKW